MVVTVNEGKENQMTPQEIEKVKSQAREYLTRKAARKAETPLQRDHRIWEAKLKEVQVRQEIKQATKPSVWQRLWTWIIELEECFLDRRTSGLHGMGKMYLKKDELRYEK